MTRVQEKVAVVTGAGSGIGRASAIRLAENGARLAITDIDAEELEATASAVQATGASVVQVAGDIVDPATIDELASAALDSFGRIDVLDNNVGVVVVKRLEEHTVADFDRLMHVNCWSYLLTTQRIAPEMRKVGGGSIINISSVGGLVALPMVAAYCASKAAVIGLTRSIAYELAPEIRCNVICPGGVRTPMSDAHIAGFGDRDEALRLTTGRQLQKRFAEPDEIAEAVVFLASDESSFMTAAVVPVEAGHTAW
jgi:NAD(P)-dependent dehydrogenase (short-subunit alcohol dehydrogenase family)